MHLFRGQQSPGGHGQGRRQAAQDVDLAGGIAGAQTAWAHQLPQDHPGQGGREQWKLTGLQPGAETRGGAINGRYLQRQAGTLRGQGLDLARRHHPDHGGQRSALVEGRSQYIGHKGPEPDHLAQQLFDLHHDHGMGRALRRCLVRQVHQPVEAGASTAHILQGTANNPGHDEGPLRLAGHPVGDISDRTILKAREQVATPGDDEAFEGLVGQFLVVANELMDRLSPVLALGHGDFLDGMLKLDTRGFQLFGQIRAVQQFESRNALACQPVLQHPADRLARLGGVEILRRRAARPGRLSGYAPLASDLGCPARQHGHAVEQHGVQVEGFPGHTDSDSTVVSQYILGGPHGHGAVLCRHVEAPGCRRGLADIEFVVDGADHQDTHTVNLQHGTKALSLRFVVN